jgi:mRNA interferase MazF
LVIQSDWIAATESILLCQLTSELDVPPGLPRIPVQPSLENGLKEPSYIMVDKILAARRTKCGKRIGRIEPEVMVEVNAALFVMIGLAD